MSREEKRYLIEVHVTGICFRETENNIQVLIAKRNNDRELYPGKWECGGGQVYAGENLEEAVKRQMSDELGVLVNRIVVFGTYEMETPHLEQKKIPAILFVCYFSGYVDGKGPKINPKEHSEWKWQPIDSLSGIDFIAGIPEEIKVGWEFYNNYKSILR
jgi:ADP-ribose pyrophosphatase YjhB (NUDIX family)